MAKDDKNQLPDMEILKRIQEQLHKIAQHKENLKDAYSVALIKYSEPELWDNYLTAKDEHYGILEISKRISDELEETDNSFLLKRVIQSIEQSNFSGLECPIAVERVKVLQAEVIQAIKDNRLLKPIKGVYRLEQLMEDSAGAD